MASWFGGASAQQKEMEMKMAKMEYEGMTNTLHRITSKCFKRCAKDVNYADLSTSEMLCLDRCTQSYLTTINLVGIRTEEISRKFGPEWMQQQMNPPMMQ